MRRRAFLLCAILAVLLVPVLPASAGDLAALAAPPRAKSGTPWTAQKFLKDPKNFQFAIVADRTGGPRPGVFERAVEALNLMQPEFVMCVGDLIPGYENDAAKIDQQWTEFEGIVARLEMPFCHIGGNHDLTNPKELQAWQKRFGSPYSSFVYRDTLFLCLDSEDPLVGNDGFHFSEQQIAFAAKTLAANPRPRWTMVFMHFPAWLDPEKTGWGKIEALLKDRPHTVFAGHHHTYTAYERNGRDYIKLATTGGASGLAGADAGNFDQIVWVTMTGKGPRIANIGLDAIRGKDFISGEAIPVSQALSANWLNCKIAPSDKDTFREGGATVHLTNAAPRPMKVHFAFRAHERLRISPAALDIVLEPKQQKDIAVTLLADEKTAAAALAPLEIDATATCEIPGRAPMTRSISAQARFTRTNETRATKNNTNRE